MMDLGDLDLDFGSRIFHFYNVAKYDFSLISQNRISASGSLHFHTILPIKDVPIPYGSIFGKHQ